MKKIASVTAIALLAWAPVAFADQPADKPTQGVGNSIDCSFGVDGLPKNIGQWNQAAKDAGFKNLNDPALGNLKEFIQDNCVHSGNQGNPS